MSSLDFETEAMRPVSAECSQTHLSVTLADGRVIGAPLWWYPFLDQAAPAAREPVELQFSGVWWPELDEGVSVKGLFLGWKAPGATEPAQAA